jgi:hypothetical protein
MLLFDEFDEFHDKRRNDDGVDVTEQQRQEIIDHSFLQITRTFSIRRSNDIWRKLVHHFEIMKR